VLTTLPSSTTALTNSQSRWLARVDSFWILQDGTTALIMAAKQGDKGVLNALISAGADPKVADNVRWALVFLSSPLRLFITTSARVTRVHWPCCAHRASVLAIVYVSDISSVSLLCVHAQSEVLVRAQSLYSCVHEEAGVLVRVWYISFSLSCTRAQAGVTPLHEAASQGRIDAIGIFIKGGVDVNAATTVMHMSHTHTCHTHTHTHTHTHIHTHTHTHTHTSQHARRSSSAICHACSLLVLRRALPHTRSVLDRWLLL
jgi:ankyrin repeat protein